MLSARPLRLTEHVHLPPAARQEDRGLARGVASADDDHVLAAAEVRLDLRRRVVDAEALEAREVREVGLPVLDARRDDDGARLHA